MKQRSEAQGVDVLIRREDLPAAKRALEAEGFVYRHVANVDMFPDGAGTKARNAVHLVFAGEKVRSDYLESAPDVSEAEETEQFRILTLEALVRMKLTSFRDKDRTHLRDLIEVGLVDRSWCDKFPNALGERLQHLLDTPEG